MTGALRLAIALTVAGLAVASVPRIAVAEDKAAIQATLKDIEQTFGTVPGFIKKFPPAALPGAWQELKAIELSDDTALPPKTKSLISLAVAAQIPCQYCVWIDTLSAKAAGATEAEIREAVTMAALTRHWSTIFNGLQVDMTEFKHDFAGLEAEVAKMK